MLKHPNAARLFVNWFLSQEGQTIMHTLSQAGVSPPDPTLRVDVTEFGRTLASERRTRGATYWAEWESWSKLTEAEDYAEKVFNDTR